MRARQQVYLIEPLGESEDGDHAVYRQEHLKVSGNPVCGSTSNNSTLYDHEQDQGPRLSGLLKSRSWVGAWNGDHSAHLIRKSLIHTVYLVCANMFWTHSIYAICTYRGNYAYIFLIQFPFFLPSSFTLLLCVFYNKMSLLKLPATVSFALQ